MKKFLLTLATLFALSGAATAQNYGPGPQPVPIGTVQVIGNQGIPMVLLGSATYGSNGAATLTTALAATPAITKAVCGVPADSITSAIPVAFTWYYCTFSSVTAVTFCNNTYVGPGTPVYPGSCTAFVTTGNGAVAGNSSAQTAYSLSVPGNLVGLNGGLRATYGGDVTNTAGAKTFMSTYGTMTLQSLSLATNNSFANLAGFKNAGQTGKQLPLTAPTATSLGAVATDLTGGTVDTTATQTFAMSMTNAAPATNNMVLANTTVELLPSVP